MADEITLAMSLSFSKSGVTAAENNGSFTDDVAGTDVVQGTQIVTTSEAALNLGAVTAPGWFCGRNTSATAVEIISIRQATGAANLVAIPAGGEVLFKFDAACTAPFVISASGSPVLEYSLVEA